MGVKYTKQRPNIHNIITYVDITWISAAAVCTAHLPGVIVEGEAWDGVSVLGQNFRSCLGVVTT